MRVFPFPQFIRRAPFVSLVVVVLVSNLAGSVFNFLYNDHLIVRRLMDEAQQRVFWQFASPLYNALAYPICMGTLIALLVPLRRCQRLLRSGQEPPRAYLEHCQRRVVNLPFYQVCLNFLGWLPGAVFFPWAVCTWGGEHQAGNLWLQFAISFVVSALFTTVQTFFLVEAFLVEILYPEIFRAARPAQVEGVVRIRFGLRLFGLWLAVGVMPLIALWAVARQGPLGDLALGVLVVGIASGFLIFWVLRRDLGRWIKMHAAATEEIAGGNFEVRIRQQRPDEWGRLSDHFNDMAAALSRGEQLRETFGQFVGPEVRDEIMQRFPGLEVARQDITVLFADIRGFTRRSSAETPERIGALLNRFLTLAVRAIEENGGWVNKFLGDGVMALFGATSTCDDHADRALASARALLERLGDLNCLLAQEGIEPLAIGIGIHSGPALVGCFGATLTLADGKVRIRKEFSAIGETVNLAQRVEQMTKHLGGPVLISHATRDRLQAPSTADDMGEHAVTGSPQRLRFFKVCNRPLKNGEVG